LRRSISSIGFVVALMPYVRIARFDHWFKNVFVLPGIVVAVYAQHDLFVLALGFKIATALLAIGLVASSYYVMNEVLDAPYDRLHPIKRLRPVPSGQVRIPLAQLECGTFLIAGLAIGYALNQWVFVILLILFLSACAYNIPPVRTKDHPYVDVLTESFNNPLRLLLGWFATGIETVPPVSLIAAYWMLGAFFMAIKRYAEYRELNDAARAAAYRKSFAFYDSERLLVSIIFYGVAFGLFLGVFLQRYRMELILSVPFIAAFMAWYMHLGFLRDSPTQAAEQLFEHRYFIAFGMFSVAVFFVLLFVDVPVVEQIFVPTISVGAD
jgi:decaprenyl-phosphate phosphoribosyltransferase